MPPTRSTTPTRSTPRARVATRAKRRGARVAPTGARRADDARARGRDDDDDDVGALDDVERAVFDRADGAYATPEPVAMDAMREIERANARAMPAAERARARRRSGR